MRKNFPSRALYAIDSIINKNMLYQNHILQLGEVEITGHRYNLQ